MPPLAVALALAGCGSPSPEKPDHLTDSADTAAPCPPDDSTCNGVDDDCDGVIDELSEPPTPIWYPDLDGDGFGDGSAPVSACTAPADHLATAGDCDDTSADRHPDAHDPVGDGIDQDCDGVDATCSRPPDDFSRYVGDVVLDGPSAAATAADLCVEYDAIAGSVTLQNTDWTDLSALGCLCEISEGLVLDTNADLSSLAGLPADASLGRRLELWSNASLTTTAGLAGTRWMGAEVSVEQLVVRENPQLIELSGLDGWTTADLVQIRENDALVSLSGPPDLTAVLESLEVRDNPVLESVAGFDALRSVVELRIEGNPRLTSIAMGPDFEQVRYLTLGTNALADLTAFGTLRAIDTRLTVRAAPALTSLEGLDSLERLGGLRVEHNPVLDSLQGLQDASAAGGVSGTIELQGNPELKTLSGLDWMRWVDGDLIIGGTDAPTPLLSLTGLEQLEVVTGRVVIQRTRLLHSLDGLDALKEVGALHVDGTDQLASDPFTFAGVPSLTTIHGTLDLRNHPSVVDLAGLESVTSIEDLYILDNPTLQALDGLEGLRSADDLIVLRNAHLADISALNGLTSFGDVCIEAPDNPDEPAGLLDALGTVETCP